jgi:phage FluMu protein Com
MNCAKCPHVGAPCESGKVKCPDVKTVKDDTEDMIRRANEEYDRQCEENGDI